MHTTGAHRVVTVLPSAPLWLRIQASKQDEHANRCFQLGGLKERGDNLPMKERVIPGEPVGVCPMDSSTHLKLIGKKKINVCVCDCGLGSDTTQEAPIVFGSENGAKHNFVSRHPKQFTLNP